MHLLSPLHSSPLRLQSSTIYAGSPRDLILKRDALESLRELNGCALHYRIFESWKLLKIQNLVAENAVLGR
jgi:hypothetical protein